MASWFVRDAQALAVPPSLLGVASRSASSAEPREHAGIGPLEHRPSVAPERYRLEPEPLELARRRLEEDTRVPSGPIAEQSAGSGEVDQIDAVALHRERQIYQ